MNGYARSLSKYSTPAANPVWRPPAVLQLLRVATATRRRCALPDDTPSEFSLFGWNNWASSRVAENQISGLIGWYVGRDGKLVWPGMTNLDFSSLEKLDRSHSSLWASNGGEKRHRNNKKGWGRFRKLSARNTWSGSKRLGRRPNLRRIAPQGMALLSKVERCISSV